MSASRKLYNEMANRMKRLRPDDPAELFQWRADVLAITGVFKQDNSGFDKARFLKASGFTADELTELQHIV
jgi:hypothetical protein